MELTLTSFLRLAAVKLALIFSIYFQWSFDLGIFPQTFKTAKIISIIKSSGRKILGNYRLIALLFITFQKYWKNLSKLYLINFFQKIKFYTQINMVLELQR